MEFNLKSSTLSLFERKKDLDPLLHKCTDLIPTNPTSCYVEQCTGTPYKQNKPNQTRTRKRVLTRHSLTNDDTH